MYLAEKSTGHLVEILDLKMLFNPLEDTVTGRSHYGEEAQEPEKFRKVEMSFPSGETLPRCWIDSHYRNHAIRR